MGFAELRLSDLGSYIWAWLAASDNCDCRLSRIDVNRYGPRDFSRSARLYRAYLRAAHFGTPEERATAYGSWLRWLHLNSGRCSKYSAP